MTEAPRRAGFIALLGAPNTGKSTLVNYMVGSKISIVTPKVQTTRSRVRGIRMVDNTQLVLVDTPGIFTPKRRLERSMVHAAWRGADEADALVLLIDATRGLDKNTRAIIEALKQAGRSVIVALNKIDLPAADPDLYASEIEHILGIPADEVLRISAKTGEGVPELLDAVIERIPAPDGEADDPLQALIFDSHFDQYRGVVSSVRVMTGTIRTGEKVRFMQAGATYEADEVGVRAPTPTPVEALGRTGDPAERVAKFLAEVREVFG